MHLSSYSRRLAGKEGVRVRCSSAAQFEGVPALSLTNTGQVGSFRLP